MSSQARVNVDVLLDPDSFHDAMPEEVRAGLSETPKQLPSKYFYDERGSKLFEEITRLPEYYPTRAEEALLREFAPEIARSTRFAELVELGSGVAEKTRTLIEAGLGEGCLERVVTFDVSAEVAEQSARELAERYPTLQVHAIVGDFDHHLGEIPPGRDRLVAFLGSTIGNFPGDESVALLRRIGQLVGDRDWLLLGTDLVKDRAVLEAAYNDSRGVTAEFNRNILRVLNENLQGDLDPQGFRHVAFFNDEEKRMEMHLRSLVDQKARLEAIDLELEFAAGELIRTEVSCKYTEESVRNLLDAAGYRLREWYTGEQRLFGLSLSRRAA